MEGLMLHLFPSKFDLEQTELEMIKGYLAVGGVAMLDQTRKFRRSMKSNRSVTQGHHWDNSANRTREEGKGMNVRLMGWSERM
ncbi:uncharacterized protein N7506_005649 [Penicillium brevicompactum]|uniref:uncharacterized protein n=1 Tax=Penicillium brevicompactum TaxID=5074 RepID=UPI0025419156|nr:uncharacterized protein N7506_005649 [Penicillium brevicompactum]KAJ5335713.1 hypothetical protein N7506_005649 [Penicillium brevicompactum]